MSEEGTKTCEEVLESVSQSGVLNISYEELTVQARYRVENFIQGRYFAGEPCGNLTEVFEPVFTNLGILGK